MRERVLELVRSRFYTDDDVRRLGREAVPAIASLLAESGEEAEMNRYPLVHMLGVLDGPEAVAVLAGLFREAEGRDETLQVAAAEALARTDRPEALEIVLPALAEGGKRLRKNVVAGLADSARPEVLERVRLAAASDPDDAVRARADEAARAIADRLSGGASA
jgi:HEAT repeat protein